LRKSESIFPVRGEKKGKRGEGKRVEMEEMIIHVYLCNSRSGEGKKKEGKKRGKG